MREASGAFRLIVGREVRERLRSGGFWASTWLSVLAVVLALAAPSLRARDDAALHVGVVGTAVGAPLQRQLLALVTPADQLDLAEMPAFADEASARAALRARAVDVIVVDTDRLLTLDPVDLSGRDRRTALVLAVERVLASTDALVAAGLNANQITKVQAAADTVTVEAVTSSTAVIDRGGRRAAAAVGAALIVVFSLVYGTWMLDGVLEEKSSRVVELLLITVRPAQLLRGKVVGIGLVAVAQGALLAATALGVSGIVDSAGAIRDDKALVLGILVWFVLGYACYASAFALVAAASRRHADAQGASFLVLAPLLAAAGAAAPALVGGRPDTLLRVLSVAPFTSPVAMPARLALEHVRTADVLGAGAGLVVVAALLLVVGGRAYARTVLDPASPLLARRRRR